jgi:NhaA family Na+:H+ antiporter
MAEIDAPKLKVPVGNRDHAQGPDDAPVTLLEYGDYECPYCRQVVPIVEELRERFGDRLRYVFRHLPVTTSHPAAQLAAEAAEAAAAQGEFWEMHELLYEHQDELDRAHLVEYASEIGLDVERFERELDARTYADRVRQDFVGGVRSGANGTPTFYLNGVRYDGPWDFESLAEEIEKPLGVRVRFMFQQFTRLQASGGILLLAATVLALLWANSTWGQSYFELWETYLKIILGDVELGESLLHWVNDGLMVIFFFLVGLEIKREVLVGELASLRHATLPLMAAVGGMVVPAVIYLLFNLGGVAEAGWGIPMATDIAFLLGLLTVLGSRIPVSLKVFFTALAIADDLGAVLVIAVFYSSDISWIALAVAAVFMATLIILNWGQVRQPLPYIVMGIGLWLAFLQSGIHPTIAGVLLAMTIPARTRVRSEAFLAQCTSVLGRFEPGELEGQESGRQQAAAQTLESIAERLQAPLRRLEHSLNPWVAYLIVPIFAFANAGVHIRGDIGAALTSPLSLGIIGGLVLGKPLGITLFSWIAVKLGIADLPAEVTWPQLFSASWLAGIGFTMALFIANAAFADPILLDVAKFSVLIASLLASVIGFGLLLLTTSTHRDVSQMDQKSATAQVQA